MKPKHKIDITLPTDGDIEKFRNISKQLPIKPSKKDIESLKSMHNEISKLIEVLDDNSIDIENDVIFLKGRLGSLNMFFED